MEQFVVQPAEGHVKTHSQTSIGMTSKKRSSQQLKQQLSTSEFTSKFNSRGQLLGQQHGKFLRSGFIAASLWPLFELCFANPEVVIQKTKEHVLPSVCSLAVLRGPNFGSLLKSDALSDLLYLLGSRQSGGSLGAEPTTGRGCGQPRCRCSFWLH